MLLLGTLLWPFLWGAVASGRLSVAFGALWGPRGPPIWGVSLCFGGLLGYYVPYIYTRARKKQNWG